ncbi:MAG: hypothetical protein ACREBO_12655 [Novosphingobium sp.]
MNEPKSFASLEPTLLARKGGAKPAMRPQLTPIGHFNDGLARQAEDDLGWNDMGHDNDAETLEASFAPVAEIVPILSEAEPAVSPLVRSVPEVVLQQKKIADRVVAHRGAATSARPPRARRSALSEGRRAAFTLRVDTDRHLALRLACAVRNRSAQQLVTEALDRLLSELPEVAALADQVKQR